MHQFNRQKFKTMLHHICSVCPPESVGRTKLNKAAYYADMLWHVQTGKPLTGETYVKQEHGPVARHLRAALEALVAEGALEEKLVAFFGLGKYEYVVKQKADTSAFTAEELGHVERVAEFVCLDHTARSISDLSHTPTWDAAKPGEELPYETAIALLAAEIDDEDLAWSDEEANRLEDTRPEFHSVRGSTLRSVCQTLSRAE